MRTKLDYRVCFVCTKKILLKEINFVKKNLKIIIGGQYNKKISFFCFKAFNVAKQM